MGNRAVITASKSDDVARSKDIGIYLHWNGGRDSVEGFLAYGKIKGFREPDQDNYGWARLCQIIANYFSDGLSIGIDTCDRLDCDNWDNGVYIISGWNIVGRKYYKGREQQNYNLLEFVKSVDECQPERERLGPDEVEKRLKECGLI